MLKYIQTCSFFLLTFIFCIVTPAQSEETKNILVLHSYHNGFTWTDNITRGIQSVVEKKQSNIEIYYEYLDTKRYGDVLYKNELIDFFASKYPSGLFDVIIAVDNNALKFVKNFRKSLFKATPIVFCGINNFNSELVKGIEQITGVVEMTDYKGTLKLIATLHPDTKNIIVVLDKTDTGRAIKKEFLEVIDVFQERFSFKFYQDFILEEIGSEVSKLSSEDIIYMLIYCRDRNNKFVSHATEVELLSRASNRPIYGSWDFYIGKGILGGMINSGVEQGKEAAKMVLRILDGEKASEIPINKSIVNECVFDYRQMKRFNVKASQLPKGSIIINTPPTLYDRYKKTITIALFITVLISFILLLKYRIQKQKQLILINVNEQLDQRVKEKTIELIEESAKLNKIINTAPSPVYYTDTEGRYGGFNNAFADKIIGLPRGRLMGQTLFDIPEIITTKHADFYYAKDLELINNPGTQSFEAKIKCADGIHRDYFFNKATLSDVNGNISGIVCIMLDISERKKIENDLMESRERFKTLLEASFGGIIIHEEGQIIDVNQGLVDITGYSVEELKKLTGLDLIAPDFRIDVAKKVLSEDESLYDVEGIKKDGTTYPLEIQAKMIPYDGRMIRATGLRDISDKKNAEKEKERLILELQESNEKLEKLSMTDSLTGLNNRRYIFERLALEMTKANRYLSSLSIILVDIDNFKKLNDTYGHPFGDTALQKTGRVFRDTIREIDMVGRYGGEEFLFVLPNTEIAPALLLAERIRKKIEEIIWDKEELIVTLSGGVVQYSGELRNDFLKNADELLYQAKSFGKNRIESSSIPKKTVTK